MLRGLLVAVLLLSTATPLGAASAIEEYAFDTDRQEERFKQLIFELRCPMCLNSNLAGSDAPIAADLRQEIYSQIIDGRSDTEIIDFLQTRYGDFILYRPPLNAATFLLWFGPVILLLAGFCIARRMMLSSNAQPAQGELSEEENQKLQAILSGRKESDNS